MPIGCPSRVRVRVRVRAYVLEWNTDFHPEAMPDLIIPQLAVYFEESFGGLAGEISWMIE